MAWIPITERLPKQAGWYWLRCPSGAIYALEVRKFANGRVRIGYLPDEFTNPSEQQGQGEWWDKPMATPPPV